MGTLFASAMTEASSNHRHDLLKELEWFVWIC